MPIWMIAATWAARLILIILVGLSIWSVAIILDKIKKFKELKKMNWEEQPILKKAHTLNLSQIEHLFEAEMPRLKKEWEQGLGILGTLGSSTPFIGLLGTILGIIVAFGELSQGKADTNAIMFALAEALILTAFGLFVAIPAVVAFNYFNRELKYVIDELNSKKNELILKKEK